MLGVVMLEAKALSRILWRQRGSSVAAISMVAAAAAAATTTFVLADAVLWRSLPYGEPSNLAILVTTHASGTGAVSLPDFTALRDHGTRARVAAAGAFVAEYALTGFGDPRQLTGRMLTSGYFDILGVRLAAGRDFSRDEETTGTPDVIIITDRVWADLFNRSADALGAALPLNGRSYKIVGIAAPYKDPFGSVDVYVPSQFAPTLRRRFRMLTPVARLTGGASLRDLRDDVRRLTANTGDPDAAGYTVEVRSLQEHFAASARSSVWFLFAGAVGLLATAIINFSMLAAVRTHQRMDEFSIRLALGATPGKILRLAAGEAAALTLLAAALAIALAHLLVPLLQSRYGHEVLNEITIDKRALVFLAIMTILTVSVAAIAASRAFFRRIAPERLIVSSPLTFGRTFVIAQAGVSLVLVVSSVLLARTFERLTDVDPGFRTAGIYTTRIALPAGRYRDPGRRVTFFHALIKRLKDQGVKAAGLTSELPLTGQDNPTSFTATMSDGGTVPVNIRSISPGYLQALGVSLHSGRGFSTADGPQAPRTVIISEGLAERLRRLGEPLGQSLTFDFGGGPMPAQVVGIVRDIRHVSLRTAATPEAYFPCDQTPLLRYSLVLSGPATERDAAAVLRAALRTVDPGQPFGLMMRMSDYVRRDLALPRFQAQFAGLFALVSLIVAAAGLYSLLAYLVAGSRREWALRLALGASHATLVKRVLGQSATYTLVGVVVGVALLAIARSTLRALLYGVSMSDPVIVFACAGVIVAVGVLAATIPALRARRISAAEVLKL